MTNEAKQEVMREIEKNSPVFMKVSPIQYRIRCPICGDSQKNPRDAHCYLKCSYDPNEPILYKCFKCNAGGMVNKGFLEKLHIKSDVINLVSKQRYNRISTFKKANVDVITGSPIMGSPQARYIEKRLDHVFNADDLDRFKIIWDMGNLYQYITDQRTRNSMPSNLDSVSFLSDDKSMILTRSFDDENGRWRKIQLFPNEGRSLYTIKTQVDIFNTNIQTNVFIAEGIMDVISIYRMFGSEESNAFIAVLGSEYTTGIEYAISKGLIGKSVAVQVFIDDDVKMYPLVRSLVKYKWLFKSIDVVRNVKSKDVGVPMNMIGLQYKRV